MSKKMKTIKCWFVVCFSSFAISSVAPTFILLIQHLPEKVQPIVRIIIAIILYSGILIGVFSTLFINKLMSKWKKTLIEDGQIKKQRLPGIITFSSNVKNIILYSICSLGILVSVSDIIFHYIPEYIMFPVLSVTIFTFTLHCIVDGENFKLYQAIKEGMNNG